MSKIILGKPKEAGLDRQVLAKMFALRHQVFRQKLGWNVVSVGGEERDAYDELDPHYMISLDDGKASGCWRLLPTSGPYMLRNTFPSLLRGELAPRCRSVWELSRFAVLSPARRYNGQIHLSGVAFAMFDALLDFADERHIDHYVTVMSTSVERLMMSNGISLERFGDGVSTEVDGVESVACRIRPDISTREVVASALDRLEPT